VATNTTQHPEPACMLPGKTPVTKSCTHQDGKHRPHTASRLWGSTITLSSCGSGLSASSSSAADLRSSSAKPWFCKTPSKLRTSRCVKLAARAAEASVRGSSSRWCCCCCCLLSAADAEEAESSRPLKGSSAEQMDNTQNRLKSMLR
jgi:hypothetical protein